MTKFDEAQENEQVVSLPLIEIETDPDQPRKVKPEAEIVRIGRSIEQEGQIQPIIVRPHPDPTSKKKYMIVCGECRYQGHMVREKLRERGTIKAVIRNYTNDDLKKVRRIQMIENSARINQQWLETADSFVQAVKDGDTPEELAEALGFSVSIINRDIALAGLPDQLRNDINGGKCPFKVAEHLLKIYPENAATQTAAWKSAKGKKKADDMIAAMDAFAADKAQKTLFPEQKEEMQDKSGLKNAGKAFAKLQKALKSFEEGGYNNGKAAVVVKAKRGNLPEVEETIKTMSRMVAHYQNTIRLYKAQSGQLEEVSEVAA